MTDVHIESAQERAEQIVQEQINKERRETQTALDNTIQLEREVAKESERKNNAYWKLALKDPDAEPTEKEVAAGKKRDVVLARHLSTVDVVTSLRNKLAKLDDPVVIARKVQQQREKMEGLARLAASRPNRNGGDMPEKRKRVPVDQKVVDRIVRDVQTKSQQQVADELNKEGLKTAAGKPWTPQNVWHAVKRATGKGVPRKPSAPGGKRAAGASRKQTARTSAPAKPGATPFSKASQAAGTSRGGTGSRKRKVSRKVTRRGTKRR